jgi:hypothetical protein
MTFSFLLPSLGHCLPPLLALGHGLLLSLGRCLPPLLTLGHGLLTPFGCGLLALLTLGRSLLTPFGCGLLAHQSVDRAYSVTLQLHVVELTGRQRVCGHTRRQQYRPNK